MQEIVARRRLGDVSPGTRAHPAHPMFGRLRENNTMRLRRWGVAAVLLAMALGAVAQKHPAKTQKAKPQSAPLELAITFDDLPAHGPLPPGDTRIAIADRVIHALKEYHVPPTYGFVNASEVLQDPKLVDVLGAWRGSGNLLGNHTWSHMNLNQHSLEQFEGDVTDDEPTLRLLMYHQDWRWLRFPYLNEGDTAPKRMGLRAWLGKHGYKIAAVTMSFNDYEWNPPYARCVAKHDWQEVDWLEASYLHAAEENIGYYRDMSKKLYGRDIPYVLLMHIGALDSRMLPRLLRMYREHGFTFVPLEKAEQDSFYKYDADPKLLPGPDTLEAAMGEKHLPLPKHADYSKKLNAVCR